MDVQAPDQHCHLHYGSRIHCLEYCSSGRDSLLEVIRYVISSFKVTTDSLLTFKSTVHEDNQGALKLANLEPGRQTPRSKFYNAIKYYWFRSWLKPNEIEIQYIETFTSKGRRINQVTICYRL
jgi:hypothetical protein